MVKTGKAISKPIKFPKKIKVSDDLKNLLRKMIEADPKKRISWKKVFKHPWINMDQSGEYEKFNTQASIYFQHLTFS